jgi:hypothetical protein
VRGRVAEAEEEADRVERVCGRDLESFGMKSEMTQGVLLFIGSKLLELVLTSLRTASDSFRIYQQWFWFTTATDKDIISSGSRLEPLLIS